jgi:hypothetical protein
MVSGGRGESVQPSDGVMERGWAIARPDVRNSSDGVPRRVCKPTGSDASDRVLAEPSHYEREND